MKRTNDSKISLLSALIDDIRANNLANKSLSKTTKLSTSVMKHEEEK